MGEIARTPAAGASTVVGAVAAVTVGAFFGVRGLALAGQFAVTDLTQGIPLGAPGSSVPLVALAGGLLLAVVVAGAAALTRLPGWPIATAGVLVAYLAGELAFDGVVGLVPQQPPSAGQVLVVLATALGAGLALGGALLATGQLARPLRWPVAAGLAVGLVLHSGVADLVRLAVGEGYAIRGHAWPTQVGVTVLATVVAAVLAQRRGTGMAPPARRPRIGPLVAAAVAAVVTLGGLAFRWWVVEAFRVSQDGLVGPRREQFVESFAYFSTVAVATAAGLVLLGYAYRIGRAVAARWVVLGVAAGPLVLFGVRLDFVTARPQAYLVVLVGLAAVVAGAALARFAPRLLPWDAAGLLLAALALPLASPVIRAELPATGQVPPVLAALGLGLAFGFGLVLAAAAPTTSGAAGGEASAPAATEEEPSWRVGVLALGPAAMVLSAVALGPALVRAQIYGPVGGPPVTVPVFAGVGALILLLLFGFGRAVHRVRRDLRAEAALVAHPQSGEEPRAD
ncbi:hypothetical protein [Micromonospora sp. SL4-19]|uniref:hypothetical protein n=1 Tax=Micromonospora sp. SL4-19 TaxID=3399129 RepID=UPI003A4D54AD